ncbi:hypothetical protein RN001_007376 [Aquatica leii]|uniref:Uncharacterized protein n=1 Tax=Aquatica leii TaxID=1421715 RepID=A0AAN7Q4A0_9COLE|nr:hypothetical protein RN001_007376 [Aquatica leii]
MAVEQFCLKWSNFQTTIMNAFESLQTSEDLADVTLTCEGIRIKAHKLILSACSPYFRTIFKDNPCPHPIVILKDVLHQDLVAVLNFMYQGEALITQDKLNSFLQTAEALQVTGLVGNMNLRNVPSTLGSTNVPKNTSKVLKFNPTEKLLKVKKPETVSSKPKTVLQDNEGIDSEQVKVEVPDDYQSDYNCNDKIDIYDTNTLKSQSILEAALEVKEIPSILERSLTSFASKSPVMYPIDTPVIQESPPYVPETVLVKPTDDALDKRKVKHKLDIGSQPVEVVPELLQPKQIRLDEEVKIHGLPSDISVLRTAPDIQQPHHSSQCGSCPHCGKIYSNQSALKYHVRLVHSDLTNMYCCHLCPESFDYREGYKKHMVEAHSVRN